MNWRHIILWILWAPIAGCSGPDPALPDAMADFQIAGDVMACHANNDGKIDLDELVFKAGLSASYRVNPPGTLDTVDNQGKLIDGKLVWDHGSKTGVVAPVKVEPITGWYAKHFPGASFAAGTDIKAETLQVIALDTSGQRVLLMGLASRKPDETLMVYSPPIEIMRFPLRVGLKFSSTGEVSNGKLRKLPIATRDTYDIEVDREGTVRLPTLDLRRSLRMKARVTVRTVGHVEVHNLQYQWFHECFGEVVRAVAPSRSDGTWPSETFNKAAEYRRISF